MRRAELASLILAIAVLANEVRADEWNGVRCSVAPAADADGDGDDDFAVAGRPSSPTDLELRSVVGILSGKDATLVRTLQPPRASRGFGRVIEDAGDVDGDGATDLAVTGEDGVWVFSGRDGTLIHDLDGGLAGPGFGATLSGRLDVDGDEVPDLAVFRALEEWYGARTPAGVVGLYSGKTGRLVRVIADAGTTEGLPEADDLVLRIPIGRIACATALVPDRDGDGRAEIALTVRSDSAEGPTTDLVVVDAWTLEEHGRTSLRPPPEGDARAWIVDVVGDADGDGLADLAVSLVQESVLLLSSKSTEPITRRAWRSGGSIAEGTSLDGLDDVNGDGVPDLLVAANEDSLDCDLGFVMAVSGRDGKTLRRMELEPLHAPAGGGMRAIGSPCEPGADACTIADVDGDGLRDVAVHVPRLSQVRILSAATFVEIARVDTDELFEEDSPRSPR